MNFIKCFIAGLSAFILGFKPIFYFTNLVYFIFQNIIEFILYKIYPQTMAIYQFSSGFEQIKEKYFPLTYLTYLVLSVLIAMELTNLRLNKEFKTAKAQNENEN